MLDAGYDIRTTQELLGHKDVRTTMIYTRVLNRGGHGVRRPLDGLQGDIYSLSIANQPRGEQRGAARWSALSRIAAEEPAGVMRTRGSFVG